MVCAEAAFKRSLASCIAIGERARSGEMRELGMNQVLSSNCLLFVPDWQILIGRKRPDALGEPLDKVFRPTSGKRLRVGD